MGLIFFIQYVPSGEEKRDVVAVVKKCEIFAVEADDASLPLTGETPRQSLDK